MTCGSGGEQLIHRPTADKGCMKRLFDVNHYKISDLFLESFPKHRKDVCFFHVKEYGPSCSDMKSTWCNLHSLFLVLSLVYREDTPVRIEYAVRFQQSNTGLFVICPMHNRIDGVE